MVFALQLKTRDINNRLFNKYYMESPLIMNLPAVATLASFNEKILGQNENGFIHVKNQYYQDRLININDIASVVVIGEKLKRITKENEYGEEETTLKIIE